MLTIVGQCTGGLSCDGGCCRKISLIDGEWKPNGYCDHYDQPTGTCKVYNRREEVGFGGCINWPTIDSAVRNGLPENCGFSLVDVNDSV